MPETQTSENYDVREQLTRIDRAIEETRKFSAESRKLAEEASKIRVERYLAPVLALGTIIGGAITALVAAILAHRLH